MANDGRSVEDLADQPETESRLDPLKKRLRAFIVATVAIGLIVVLGGLVLFDTPAEREEIKVADDASAQQTAAMKRFTAKTTAEIADKKADSKKDFSALLTLVEGRIDKAPTIATKGTTAFGRENSRAYRTAKQRRDFNLRPFQELARFLREDGIPDMEFIASGKKLVQVNPAKILANVLVNTGTPLRDMVIPAFKKAKADLEKQETPTESELLQLDLKTYADDAISMTEDGADDLDQGLGFVFDFADRPAELFRRLSIVETTVKGELSTRIDELESPS